MCPTGRDKCSDIASVSTAPRWRVTTEPATDKAGQPPQNDKNNGPATASMAQPPTSGKRTEPANGHHQNGLSSKGPTAELQQGVQTTVFDAVISCVGNYTEPNLPEVGCQED